MYTPQFRHIAEQKRIILVQTTIILKVAQVKKQQAQQQNILGHREWEEIENKFTT